MKNVVDKLLGSVDAEQLMQVILKVTQSEPMAVMQAFDDVLSGDVVNARFSGNVLTISQGGITAAVPESDLAHVADLMRVGKKVSAIKHLRTVTGWGLKETKCWCEENCIQGAS